MELVDRFYDLFVETPGGPWMVADVIKLGNCSRAQSVLSIDVGGSTFRTALASVNGQDITYSETRSILMPDIAKQDLETWIGETLFEIVRTLTIDGERLPVAVSWAFPLIDGKISAMGKGFTQSLFGTSLQLLFERILLGAEVPRSVYVGATLNDGTATLLANHSQNPQCRVSLIWGSGVNINYIDAVTGKYVNTELSMIGQVGYGAGVLGLRGYEQNVIRDTPEPELQLYEKLVGGIYLVNLVRSVAGRPLAELSPDDLWQIFAEPRHSLHGAVRQVVERALQLVAAAVCAAVRRASPGNGHVVVAVSGGVVAQPVIFESLSKVCTSLATTSTTLHLAPLGPQDGAVLLASSLANLA